MKLEAKVSTIEASIEISQYLLNQGYLVITRLEGGKYCIYTDMQQPNPVRQRHNGQAQKPVAAARKNNYETAMIYAIVCTILGAIFLKLL